ncbi:MAG: helix-turn-helix transcriptional regulator [Tuberibacillus sp.]
MDNRLRLLKVMQILQNETDEENELSIYDIKERLKKELDEDNDIKNSILRDDINALNRAGIDIDENVGERGKKFYRHEGLFELHEVKLLLDAVVSARFLTLEETRNLIKKIKQLKSRNTAKKLSKHIYLDGVIKAKNASVRFGIDKIQTAISERKKIVFRYGRYNVDKEFVLSHDGATYTVHPYALIWNSDYYYLIGFYEKAGEIRHYRVDRMRDVNVKDEKYKMQPLNIPEYVNRSFHMFAGEEEWIRLEVDNELINVMIDRFGLEADIRKASDTSFYLTALASVSEGLISWILTWGSKVKVLSPEHLQDRLKEESEKMWEQYRK